MQPTFKYLSLVSLVFLVSCQSNRETPPAQTEGAKAPEPKPFARQSLPEGAPKPPAKYDPQHDALVKEIFDLASKSRWTEAEAKAQEFVRIAPGDDTAKRLLEWTAKEGQDQRTKAVEEKIQTIDASKDTTFNPTLNSFLSQQNGQGLPLRKDVREAVQKIENSPYIPETFGKVIHRKETLVDFENKETPMSRLLEKEISVHLDNVTLEAVIFNIGQAEGINFVADKSLTAFKQTLSLNMNKVKLGEFLRYVSRNLDVQFQIGNDLIWITDAKDPKRMLEETRVYHLKHGFVMPAEFGPVDVLRTKATVNNVTTVTEGATVKKFVNDGAAPAPALDSAIKQFFTGTKYLIDYERNLVVARGTPDQLETMDKIVEAFDKPLQQVLIEARFITISSAAFLQLGVAWQSGNGPEAPRTVADITDMGTFNGNTVGVGGGVQQTFTNGIFKSKILSQPDLKATLSALQQSGESQTLSAPRLTLVNNLPAMINDGQVQYYYEEYTVAQTTSQYFANSSLVPAGKPTKITAGVCLYVLASIGGDGRILLALNPQVNQGVQMATLTTVSDGTNTFELKLPQYRTQELSTRMVVKSGETVAMGGVLEKNDQTFTEAVPLLSRIPILGALFRKRTDMSQPRYLLIFVTATLLSENGEMIVTDDPNSPRTVAAPVAARTVAAPAPKVTTSSAK